MTVPPTLDVVAIGNAIVDVIAHASDDFLAEHAMTKGAMTLVDEPRAEAIYEVIGPAVESSGGSAGNTAAGIASLGGRAAYVGKVRDDALGRVYRHDITAAGVAFDTPAATAGAATARCLILVTPDAERTMNTFLGACAGLAPADVDPATIAAAAITYMEGYLFDPPQAQEAFRTAARLAHEAGRRVSLSLSDAFCVVRHRAAFLELIERHIDLLFANEAELLALFETTDLARAIESVRPLADVVAVTLGAGGSRIVAGDRTIEIAAEPVAHVVDTTGAGDLYAAGFLFGYARGESLETCGRLGSFAAAEVIGHYGGRPQRPLRDLLPAGARARA